MKKSLYLVFAMLIICFVKAEAQCDEIVTYNVCDMTTIDKDANGTPDGIINLYDVYNAIPGASVPISLSSGSWFDPNYSFALDPLSGDLYLWDLGSSSSREDTYQFELIDTSSTCTGGRKVLLNIVLGPYEGKPLPASGINDVNVSVCQSVLGDFDLFQVFESQPSPHKNGVWRFIGNMGDPDNFIGLDEEGKFQAEIPYIPYGDLVEFDVFEFTYTVSGIGPCASEKVSRFKVQVIRDVLSGDPSTFDICETDILAGNWDADIDLTSDVFLIGEDAEGTWSASPTTGNQIDNPSDSSINIRAIYDELKLNNPNFGCAEFTYTYTVEARSSLSDCASKESDVIFRIYEPIKPFKQEAPLEVCLDVNQPTVINLYNEITFTIENGILYDYPPNVSCTNWNFVSGPSDIRVDADSGIINLSTLTQADAGTYVFQYLVSSSCNSCNSGGMSPCNPEFANITVVLYPNHYAGEDTTGLEFCETDPLVASPLNLFSLLSTNGIDGPIYQGTMGTWRDNVSGDIITTPTAFIVPEITDKELFDFTYETVTEKGCVNSANLSFTLFEEYSPGIDTLLDVCDNTAVINLFDKLDGNPSPTGTWEGPNGFVTTDETASFDPGLSDGGTYTYTVPANKSSGGATLCSGSQSTLIVTVYKSPNAGDDVSYDVCRSDLEIDLFDYLHPSADLGGLFTDLDNTNLLAVNLLDVSQLTEGTYNFRYEIQGHATCRLAISNIEITIVEVDAPTVGNQTFCAADGATVNSLIAENGYSFNWYDTADADTPLPMGTPLVNGEDYFVTAVDENNCESPKTAMTVTVLDIDNPNCDSCIKDGVSANGDSINDEFDLCNLPDTFPNFELNILNRYGVSVYKGTINTPLFSGKSNVSGSIGNQLSTGVYFFVFDPKDGTTNPFQGNFYLSR
ncbi:gliding motility-associated C-terminal domain-containing protein [Algibacter miyuki]|uniref:Gliding motility-associated C-terminal domain-containing protein n=1 Tax=Algibacter miyuki TaxID=1306933 RepID=A0ABV5GXM0_9FLAO|nr:gliding motility-associated C-terminal domain-containing protein [Algibacter miyuki]MDN3666061.1 gliding motility-associated C-terminal domain-containing protein [Algibacter miyuki]